MRHIILLNVITLILLAVTFSGVRGETLVINEEELPDTIQNAVITAIARIKPALVRIHVVTVQDEAGREVKRESVGSGVIITKQGHLITNHHVAGRGIRIVCTLANKEEIDAELIGTDPLADISVIKLCAPEIREFPFAKFGNSDNLTVGDRILAMGSPLAFSQSVTMGIISNTELVIPEIWRPYTSITLEGEDVGSIVRWIGHDAAIYPGNSGGPLVNLKGELVGINEINLGISGAIPGNLAKKVAGELIKFGKVTRGWFGLEVQPLLKYSEQKSGILVCGTIEGSPAQKAGFLSGDILIKFAGEDVNVQFSEELPIFNQLLMACPVDQEVETVVLRRGKVLTLHITPHEREYILPKTIEIKKWGIMARNISLLAAKEMRRKNQAGILVTSVRPGGPCGEAKPSIVNNDIIVEVASKPVKKIDDLLAITEKITAEKNGPVPVLVMFERNNEQHLTVVKIGLDKLEEQGQEFEKAWLAVATQVLTKDLAKALGIPDYKGVRVTQVYENSAAFKSGIKVGDVIIAIDGQAISASEPTDVEVLSAMLRKYDVGSRVKLMILRDKKEFNLMVELEPTPRLPRAMKKYRDDNFEFTVRDIAFIDRIEENWPKEQQGVLVDEVSPGSWSALANLSVGDLILSVDKKAVKDAASFEATMAEVAKKKPRSVVFHIMRGIHNFFIELKPSWPSAD